MIKVKYSMIADDANKMRNDLFLEVHLDEDFE